MVPVGFYWWYNKKLTAIKVVCQTKINGGSKERTETIVSYRYHSSHTTMMKRQSPSPRLKPRRKWHPVNKQILKSPIIIAVFGTLFLVKLLGLVDLFHADQEMTSDEWLQSFIPLLQQKQQQQTTTFALIRAIGNALPPRHQNNQTIDNLRFTLQHENDFPGLIKHWVLNRLVDKAVQQEVVELLEQFGHNYTIIPFDLHEYSKLKLNFDIFQPQGLPDYVHHSNYVNKLGLTYLYQQANELEKNLYVCNVNGARNTMIDIGISLGVTWILPWDGNCFVPPKAFKKLSKQLAMENGKYSLTNTHRVVGDNSQILDPKYELEPSEEPMISFRNDALGRFHPMLWYGRRDKVELLWRMKVPGPWDNSYNFSMWENKMLKPPLRSPLSDVGNNTIPHVGWAFRLNSGNPHLEVVGKAQNRFSARIESVTQMLGNLDVMVATELYGFSSSKLLFFDEQTLSREQKLFQSNHPQIKYLKGELLKVSKRALSAGPWTVMEKPKESCGPEGDCHDYFSPYPELSKVEFHGNTSHLYDRTRLSSMQYNTTFLALAYFMTGKESYASHAADAIRTWFIHEETRMKPRLRFSRIIGHGPKSNNGVIEMRDVYYMLDAFRIIQRSGALSESDQVGLRQWFEEYLRWLQDSFQGQSSYVATNNYGIFYDIQVISVAAFVNNTQLMLWYLDRSISRLKSQISDSGAMSFELNVETCEHNQLVALQGWFTLARLGRVVGRDLWEAYPTTVDGMTLSALCRAAYYAIPFFRVRKECSGNIRAERRKRWWPLWYEAKRNCPNLLTTGVSVSLLENSQWNDDKFLATFGTHPPSDHYSMPFLFHPYDAIAPFWSLGLASGESTR